MYENGLFKLFSSLVFPAELLFRVGHGIHAGIRLGKFFQGMFSFTPFADTLKLLFVVHRRLLVSKSKEGLALCCPHSQKTCKLGGISEFKSECCGW